MTQLVATNLRHVLERNHAEVVSLLVGGASQSEVAQQFGVARSTVLRFVERNQAEIDAKAGRVAKAVEDYAIASKANRIAGLDDLRQRIEAWINERGLLERTITTTDTAEIVRERFAREVSAELRSVYRAAAEELGHLPRPETNVNIDARTIIVREYHGVDPARIE